MQPAGAAPSAGAHPWPYAWPGAYPYPPPPPYGYPPPPHGSSGPSSAPHGAPVHAHAQGMPATGAYPYPYPYPHPQHYPYPYPYPYAPPGAVAYPPFPVAPPSSALGQAGPGPHAGRPQGQLGQLGQQGQGQGQAGGPRGGGGQQRQQQQQQKGKGKRDREENAQGNASAPSQPRPRPQPQPAPKKDPNAFPKTAAEGTFACVTCDRGFDTQRDLAAHTAGHTRCEAPGCTFAAQRKIVLAHMSKAHPPPGRGAGPGAGGGAGAESGAGEGQDGEGDDAALSGVTRDATGAVRLPPSLLELIPPKYRGAAQVGNSAEEISRWREERRRNFPTTANVALKQAQAAARRERGGIQVVEKGLGKTGPERYRAVLPVAAQGAAALLPGGDVSHVSLPPATGSSGSGTPLVEAADGLPDVEPGPSRKRARFADELEPAGSGAGAGKAGEEGTQSESMHAAGGALGSLVGAGEGEEAEQGNEDGDSDSPPEEASARLDAYLPTACDTRLGVLPADHHYHHHQHPDVVGGGGDRRLGESRGGWGRDGAGAGAGAGPGSGRERERPVCRNYLFGGCRAGARCPYAHSAEAAERTRPGRGLLNKLLEKERLAETSMLLQCIRHIVSRGFWKDGPASASAAGAGMVQG